MDNPKLRQNLQIVRFSDEEHDGFLVRDSLIDNKTLFVSNGAAFMLMLMDGRNTCEDIQADFAKRTGHAIQTADVQTFVETLDENLLLENENYSKTLQRLQREYREHPVRPALMAGDGYPADQVELRAYLDSIFRDAPSWPGQAPDNIRGIVAPHIDIERGRNTYAKIFGLAQRVRPAATYVVLGVNHNYFCDNPFIATDRAYSTPLGTPETDKELLAAVQKNLGWNLLDDELAHRAEHSVEFPVLFLKYIYPNADFKTLPILCNVRDKADPRMDQFVASLQAAVEDREDVILLASVDFSHVGPQFGWDRPVDSSDTEVLKAEDLETLNLLADGDSEGFYANIMEDDNARSIDALHPAYVFLKTLNGSKGVLVNYEQAFDPFNTVTFAGMVF